MARKVRDFATGTTLTVEQMSNAAYAVEKWATNHSYAIAHSMNTTCGEILALVSLGKAHWYELSQREGR